MLSVGDYVIRISYGGDILFRITYISPNQIARIKGVSYRVVADAPISDLELSMGMRYTKDEDNIMTTIEKNIEKIKKEKSEYEEVGEPRFRKTGKVLHIDGDVFYLNLCLKYYEILEIPAVGEHISESEQPKRIKHLIEKYSPDILVLTGHDALNKHYKSIYEINEYKNSQYFIESVKRARAIKPSMSELVIFAGACQSYFEEILAAGADFAASPDRVLIHALDPVFLVQKIADCSFNQVLPIEEALENTITKFKGLGGYEILGKCRRGGPVVSDKVMENNKRVGIKKNTTNPSGNIKNPDRDTTEVIQKEDLSNDDKLKEFHKELAKPIFTDSKKDFEAKLRKYMNRSPKR